MDLNNIILCPHDFKWYQTIRLNDSFVEVCYRCRFCGMESCDIESQDVTFE